MLEAAEADLALEAGFCPCERSARHSRKFGRQVRRRQQTAFRVSRWRRPVLSLAARRTELHRSCGTEPPLDMLMTLQGVYEKSLGTLSPSPRRSATVDALRAIGELDLSEIDWKITQTTQRLVKVFYGYTERFT